MNESPKKTSKKLELDSLLNSYGLGVVALIICLVISSMHEYKEKKEAEGKSKEGIELSK